MAEEIAIRLTANADQANTAVKDFKTQLREAQKEVVTLSEKFGETSEQATNAAKKAALLKNSIGDAKKLIDTFNPDEKFKGVGHALAGIAGGFTAITGAMGLLGVESQDVQKQLLKVQSALALTQGLNTIGDSIQSFKNLASVVGNYLVKAFSTLRGAIISTGIGALIVGIGLLIANFEKLKDFLGIGSNALKGFNKEMKELEATAPNVAEDLKKLGTNAQDIADNYIKKLKEEINGLNKELGLTPKNADTAGAAIQLLQVDLKGLTDDLAEAEYKRTTLVGFLSQLVGISDSPESIKKKIAANKKSQQEIDQAQEDLFNLNEEKRAKSERESFEKRRKAEADRAKSNKGPDFQVATEAQKQAIKWQTEYLILSKNTEQEIVDNHEVAIMDMAAIDADAAVAEIDSAKLISSTINKIDADDLAQQKINADEKIRIAKVERDARIQAAMDVGDALGALSDLIGKQTAAGKALAIAQATINTWVGVSQVLRAPSILPEPAGTIAKIANVAAIVASGLNAVKNIVKTQVPGGGGGSAPTSSGIPANPQSPLQPTPQIGTTTLDQGSLNAVGNAANPVRAFLVEADVTNSQERISRLNRAARLTG